MARACVSHAPHPEHAAGRPRRHFLRLGPVDAATRGRPLPARRRTRLQATGDGPTARGCPQRPGARAAATSASKGRPCSSASPRSATWALFGLSAPVSFALAYAFRKAFASTEPRRDSMHSPIGYKRPDLPALTTFTTPELASEIARAPSYAA